MVTVVTDGSLRMRKVSLELFQLIIIIILREMSPHPWIVLSLVTAVISHRGETHTPSINAIQQSAGAYLKLKVWDVGTSLAVALCHLCTISKSTIHTRASRDVHSIFCRVETTLPREIKCLFESWGFMDHAGTVGSSTMTSESSRETDRYISII